MAANFAGLPDLLSRKVEGGLFQLRRDRRKGRIELSANSIHRRNDYNGNAGSDQSVFNRCCSRLVLPEPGKELAHISPRCCLSHRPGS